MREREEGNVRVREIKRMCVCVREMVTITESETGETERDSVPLKERERVCVCDKKCV